MTFDELAMFGELVRDEVEHGPNSGNASEIGMQTGKETGAPSFEFLLAQRRWFAHALL